MQIPVRLAVILGLLLGAADILRAQEEEMGDFDDFDELYLGDLLNTVFTAAKHEQDIGESPSAITVITREDIEASGATTIPDLLRMVPGMDVVMCSPFYTSITTRLHWNFESNIFQVLIDGREAIVDLIGWAPWEIQPISIEEIERIEVIRGPASSLYGANAFAGVVSITTRPVPEKPSGFVRLSGGEVGSISGIARTTARIGNWGISVSGGGDYMGRFTNPRVRGNDTLKFRTFAERRWSESQRLLIDWGMTDGTGITTSVIGTIDFNMALKTLRLAYETKDLRGQFYWSYLRAYGGPEVPLEFEGIRLAKFGKILAHAHTIDGQIQWTLPRFWEPLLIIVGGGGRASRMLSDELLDADTFVNISSSRYHKPGVDNWEIRTGVFFQGELAPVDWVTVTFGARFDYNDITGESLSPRLAAVFKPASGQFLRLGVASAFRKPSFLEYGIHLQVEFPEDGPITGPAQDKFQEFMTRVGGNRNLENEKIWSFEASYLGRFLDGRLSLGLDVYCNLYRDLIEMQQNIISTLQGLPDLDYSSYMFYSTNQGMNIIGSELSVRFKASKFLSLVASWTHRQVFDHQTNQSIGDTPKNLITLGGILRTDVGLVGSLYAFSRSEITDPTVENPAGLLQPHLTQHIDNVVLILARLGWQFQVANMIGLEIGAKLFLPISPFSAPHFRYHEKGGSVSPSGEIFGGDELRRMVIGYLQGSF